MWAQLKRNLALLLVTIVVIVSKHVTHGTIDKCHAESSYHESCEYDYYSATCKAYLRQESSRMENLGRFIGQLDTAVIETLKRSETASVLVTFRRASLDRGSDPAFLLKYYQETILPHKRSLQLGGVSFEQRLVELKIDCSASHSLASFERSPLAHLVRGYWVFESAKSSSAKTLLSFSDQLASFSRWKSYQKFIVSNSWSMEVNAPILEFLLTSGQVERIDLIKVFSSGPSQPERKEPKRKTAAGMDAERSNTRWHIQRTNAHRVWAHGEETGRGRGKGGVYASADTGAYYKHDAIRRNYLGHGASLDNCKSVEIDGNSTYCHDYCWHDAIKHPLKPGNDYEGDLQVPRDTEGHGTHTIGTAVGLSGIGVAPEAKFMACRNMDRNLGSSETYLGCWDFFLAPCRMDGSGCDPSRRPDVIGNSWGCQKSENCHVRAFEAALDALYNAGIFVVVSAGNGGPDCGSMMNPPSYEPRAFTVAALDRYDNLADFSSRGPGRIKGTLKPDISAPGNEIESAHIGYSGHFKVLSGTSMSCPQVAGAVILIYEMCPSLKGQIDKVADLLRSTAKKKSLRRSEHHCTSYEDQNGHNTGYGFGMLQIDKAVEKCLSFEPNQHRNQEQASVAVSVPERQTHHSRARKSSTDRSSNTHRPKDKEKEKGKEKNGHGHGHHRRTHSSHDVYDSISTY